VQDRKKMDEDHCQKKSLRESSNCIEISDEDEIVSLSAVESIVWDCTEVNPLKEFLWFMELIQLIDY